MTAAFLQDMPATAPAVPAVVLWPDGGRVDPGETIPQNPSTAVAHDGAASIPCASENASVSDALSLTIWCPRAFHASLQAVLAPFGTRIDADVKASGGEVAEFAASANAPCLVFFEDLAGCLADTYSGLSDDTGESLRPVADVVKDWRAQSDALLKAVRGAKAHITLIPAEVLATQPARVAQAIAGRYGLALEGGGGNAVEVVASGQAPHFALMADAIAQTAPKIATLTSQLAEACLDGTGEEGAANLRHLLAQAGAERAQYDQDLARVKALSETTIQRLRHQVDAAQLALLERDAQTTRLSEDAAQHDAAATYLKEELMRRETTYSALWAEMGVLRAAAVKTEFSRKASSERGHRLERDVSSLARNIRMRDDRIAGLATALHGYEDEALQLRAEVEALRRSTSWRLTAPVRGLSLLARKILRRG